MAMLTTMLPAMILWNSVHQCSTSRPHMVIAISYPICLALFPTLVHCGDTGRQAGCRLVTSPFLWFVVDCLNGRIQRHFKGRASFPQIPDSAVTPRSAPGRRAPIYTVMRPILVVVSWMTHASTKPMVNSLASILYDAAHPMTLGPSTRI